MKITPSLLIFLVLISGAIVGCNRNSIVVTDSITEQEKSSMQNQVANSDSIADFMLADEQIMDDEDIRSDIGIAPAGSTVETAITPIRWGRHIFWDKISKSVVTVYDNDSVATVNTIRIIPGELRIAVGTGTTIDSIIKKPFTLRVERKVRFNRVARSHSADSNWRPQWISMTYGHTSPDSINTFSIVSMSVSGKVDTTVTDPLNTWYKYGRGLHSGIPRLSVGDTARVSVTIQSQNNDSEVVFLRHGDAGFLTSRARLKMRLTSQTGSTGSYLRVYERTLTVTPMRRYIIAERLTFSVDAFSHSSLHDDSIPVSNEFWGTPYIVTNY